MLWHLCKHSNTHFFFFVVKNIGSYTISEQFVQCNSVLDQNKMNDATMHPFENQKLTKSYNNTSYFNNFIVIILCVSIKIH